MIRQLAKSTLNTLLAPFDVQVERPIGPSVSLDSYRDLIGELLACYQAHVFPGLPTVEGRVDLLTGVGNTVTQHLYLLEYLHRALNVEGVVGEFGVARGTTSALFANEILSTGRDLWLFDSFQGLSRPTEKDILVDDIFSLGSIEAYEGAMSFPEREVRTRVSQVGFPDLRTKIVPGFIEESSKRDDLPPAVCFAYIDFDLYEPILTALRLLKSRLSVGGFAIVDDYGFFSSGAQTAVDEFIAESSPSFELTLPPAYAGHFAILERKPVRA